MENVFIKTAKIIYENEGDCIDINRCEDCPFDNICDLYITDETKFELAKELLEIIATSDREDIIHNAKEELGDMEV